MQPNYRCLGHVHTGVTSSDHRPQACEAGSTRVRPVVTKGDATRLFNIEGSLTFFATRRNWVNQRSWLPFWLPAPRDVAASSPTNLANIFHSDGRVVHDLPYFLRTATSDGEFRGPPQRFLA